MELLSHFVAEKDEYLILKLKHEEIKKFADKLPPNFRNCYIKKAKIKESIEELGLEYKEILDSYIPEQGNIKSGEFGEILSYFLLKEKYLPKKLSGPKKWLWKDDKNKAVQKTDVILFNKGKTPTKDDLVVAAEIKSKATNQRKNDPITNAVIGAHDDYIQRLAITLNWLNDKYIKEVNKTNIRYLDRFRNPVKYGEFATHFKAVAVIDEALLQDELIRERDFEYFDENLEVIVVSIKNLKNTYEDTYMRIFNLGGD